MAPRRGVFMSNKVNPIGKPDAGFFIKPASSGSTTGDVCVEDGSLPREKKPFDKKRWRVQRYSKKYRVQQWEDRRKKEVLKEYYKQIDDRPKLDVRRIYEEEGSDEGADGESRKGTLGVEEKSPDPKARRKNGAKRRAHEEFGRIKEEKRKLKEEASRKKAEKREALKKSKEERRVKFKRLNKRTKKGQPIMKERMELLLEEIQRNLQK